MSLRLFFIILTTVLLVWRPLAVRAAESSQIPWKTATYSYTARQAPVSEVLTNFAAAQGIGLNMPQGLKYVVSGNFHECNPQ